MPGFVGLLDNRALLGPVDALLDGTLEELVKVRDGLHQLHAVSRVGEALVDLEDRNNSLVFPQIGGGGLAADLAVHGLLEQDRGEHPVAGEGRAGYEPGARLVDHVEHLVFALVLALVDAIELEGLRRAAAALIEGRDEALSGAHAFILFGVHWEPPCDELHCLAAILAVTFSLVRPLCGNACFVVWRVNRVPRPLISLCKEE